MALAVRVARPTVRCRTDSDAPLVQHPQLIAEGISMRSKVMGEGWKAYLGGLRDVRRNARLEAQTTPRGGLYTTRSVRPERPVQMPGNPGGGVIKA
ncbi:MAG: hypothetical protein RL684_1731 [Pseudomonadota bacterium]|jgi:hypothetical protein